MMDQQERFVLLLKELLAGIDQGDFDNIDSIPEKYTYEHLLSLYVFADALDNGIRLYEQLYDIAMACGKKRIHEKIKNNEKIKVAFLAISAAEWSAGELYHMLAQNEAIECYLVTAPLIDRDEESRKDTYRQTCQYFEQNGYDIRGGYDDAADHIRTWDELGGRPDVVIHLTPWYGSIPKEFQITSLPLNCINCYVPYGIYVADSLDKSYAVNFIYNKEFVNMMWRVYADSKRNLEGYRKYERLHGKNVIFSGYIKMDQFYSLKEYSEEEIRKVWKIPEDKRQEDVKKVIIAPHHSFLGYGGIQYSTFAKNAWFLLYLAKKYRDKVSFIFKPHPNLRLRAVEAGVFSSYEEYDAYLEEWNRLSNAKVVQETSYLDIFATSDGMIMDSASFLAEYLYVDKPLLFLRGKGQAFNELGQVLLEGHYLKPGEDYWGIEKFLLDVILKGEDSRKGIRESIWEEELDYMKINKCKACEFIYQDICSLLTR
ncbi:MAG: CDP-glycerol glycerophosphotransferase family protein [Ruminococcus flavefaciens]|nr:CDP-glycerol glycerophosphotransferase family protein [Roseburia sp.]MCM1233927.1 CDP-glycerol glycerophosphotransferase family protein [Ruminococcus flavefaciens]